MVTTELFPDVIGQSNAKRVLNFFIRGYEKTSRIPHLMFVAP